MASPPSEPSGASPPSSGRPDTSAAAGSLSDLFDARWRQLAPVLEPRLGVDTRALASFRVSIGLLVLADLLLRTRDLRAFYTDAGVLPRAAHAEVFPTLAAASLHTVSGSALGQAALFVLAGMLAGLLAVGYRTRATTLAVLVLQASLYARNPYVLNGGDGLLLVALFLGAFLPLGERWSVDALRRRGRDARGREPRERVFGLASAALLLQMVVVYIANVPFKLQSDAWATGDGVQYALEVEQFAVLLGPALTDVPTLLTAANWLWIGLLTLSPLLVLATGRVRLALALGFVACHLGMVVTLRLGLFPLVVVSFLLAYVPSSAWSLFERWIVGRLPGQLSLERLSGRPVIDRLSEARPEWGQGAAVPAAPSLTGNSADAVSLPARLRPAGRVMAVLVLVCFLVASVAWPATALAGERGADAVVETDGYPWTLFAPNTPTDTRWFVAPAVLESGDRVDALHGGDLTWEKPPDAADAYPSPLWHRYLRDMRYAGEDERRHLGPYLCREVRETHDSEVETVALYAVEQRIEAAGGGEPERVVLLVHECDGDR